MPEASRKCWLSNQPAPGLRNLPQGFGKSHEGLLTSQFFFLPRDPQPAPSALLRPRPAPAGVRGRTQAHRPGPPPAGQDRGRAQGHGHLTEPAGKGGAAAGRSLPALVPRWARLPRWAGPGDSVARGAGDAPPRAISPHTPPAARGAGREAAGGGSMSLWYVGRPGGRWAGVEWTPDGH